MTTTEEIRIGATVRIRIKFCAARRTDWLSAIRVDSNRVRVTANDPLWKGAVVNLNDPGLEVEKA